MMKLNTCSKKDERRFEVDASLYFLDMYPCPYEDGAYPGVRKASMLYPSALPYIG